ncbi:MAG: alkaline shock response membrane anchor protein AmaP [Lentisphaerae bacterium]|nr:alkaline shock response membrane anchor protein AmaP [Lentisphaerota bacterium]
MKAIRIISLLVILVAFLAGVAYTIVPGMIIEKCPFLQEVLMQDSWQRITIGVLALVAFVFYLISLLPKSKRERFISIPNDWGTVNVSHDAVGKLVSRLSNEFASIISVNTNVEAKDTGVELQVDMSVKSGTNIPELSKLFQEQARATISESLGVVDVKSVVINIREIHPRSANSSPEHHQTVTEV